MASDDINENAAVFVHKPSFISIGTPSTDCNVFKSAVANLYPI